MKRVLGALLMVAALAACETVPPVTEADRTRGYNRDTATVFEAAKQAFYALNVIIAEADKDSGFLVGKRHGGGEFITTVLTNQTHAVIFTYQITVQDGEEGHARVQARISSAYENGLYASEVGKPLYDQFFEALLAALQGK